METLLRYFPDLNEAQRRQMALLDPLYREWNLKINVISRKDIDQLYIHHVLHSLAIARFITFKPDAKVIDLGTGGGFPGIPLAILFPETQFTLLDGIRKKITVVQEIANALALTNVTALAQRAEEHRGKYDFVVSRAVAPIDKLYAWSHHLIQTKSNVHALPNGLIALKGGDTEEELKALPKKTPFETAEISDWFDDPWFKEKRVIWVER